MNDVHETPHEDRAEQPTEPRLGSHIDSASLGAIFIWVGFTLLVDGGWGMALIGVGAVVIGEQVLRRRLAVDFSQTWLLVGAALAVGGLVIALDLLGAVVPIALMVAGVVLVVTAWIRSRPRS